MLAQLRRLLGDENEKTLKHLFERTEAVNAQESAVQSLSDTELAAKTDEFTRRLKGETERGTKETLDDLLPEAFAVVREAARRTLGQRHYDVQIAGGVGLHEGNVAEMRTGEGKTLVATLPVYLNALAGTGVHIVTVNDYLARRDAAWMGQVYAFLGLRVAAIGGEQQSYEYDASHVTQQDDAGRDLSADEASEHGYYKVEHEYLRPVSRGEAYACDVVYGTNNEFGFDYLRDHLVYEPHELKQRSLGFAIIDEVDSVLIDEARTPLIIAAPAKESANLYQLFSRIAEQLQKETHYTIDEKDKAIQMTDAGIERAEELLGIDNIYTEKGIKYVHHLETAVRAKALFERDKDYVLRPGESGQQEVVIVDEFTGRLQPGRRWSEGLHQAIEAKEGVPVQQDSRTFASITFQNYFRKYQKLGGMTGTAMTSQEEFYTVYGLPVVGIPTNESTQREDHPDLIFQTEQGKFSAITQTVRELHERGQPVLIGTVSIEKNEQLSRHLAEAGIPHEVLNAKQHEREGEIIAQAGTKGRVTIATNMAGRGVDIKLGGAEADQAEYEAVRDLGGLFVLGTERHEARRIDNQLRGRAGRQGDPGETQFFVSLEDQLMRVFASEAVSSMMGRFGIPEDQPIHHKFISRSLESAQTRIEGFHFDARKQLLAYDNVLDQQRESIYVRRERVLFADSETLRSELQSIIGDDTQLQETLRQKESELGTDAFEATVRRLILQVIDMYWVEHLEVMEYMRNSVNLRAYGQRDPLIEYKKEGRRLFEQLQTSVDDKVRELLPAIQTGAFQASNEEEQRRMQEIHRQAQALAGQHSDGAQATTGQTAAVAASGEHKIGRNTVVTITDGSQTQQMKYKRAEAYLATGEWRLVENDQ